MSDLEEPLARSAGDNLRPSGNSVHAGVAARTPLAPGTGSVTGGALLRTTSGAGVLNPAPASTHHAAPSDVAEIAEDRELNAIIKVVAYGAGGQVLARVAVRAHWDGRLPTTFHGSQGKSWIWSDPAARDARLRTRADGSGGVTIEAWAKQVGANSVDVFAQAATAVTLRTGAKPDNCAPGHATAAQDAGDGSTTERAHRDLGGGGEPAGPAGGEHGGQHGAEKNATDAHEGDAADEIDDASPDPEEENFLDGIEAESHGTTDGEGDASATGGHGKPGGDPAGRTGADTTIGGAGPGGEHAKADGDGDGSVTGRDGNGTAAGDALGVKHGAEEGLFAGEGRDGDNGVRGAGAVFGGLIAIPGALKGLVELGLLIDAGDITGAAGKLFRKGIGKAASIATARRIVAREARIFARKELRSILKEVSGSRAFRALVKEERSRLMRIWLWETQRRYFRAYLKAAKAEQRLVRNALRRARPADIAALEARRGVADTAEELARAEPVAGQLPRNHAFAGKEFPRSELPPKYRERGLRFKETGYPDFEPYAQTLPNGKKHVVIEYTGSRTADNAAANKAAGYKKNPKNATWHHDEEKLGVMILVPDDLHAAASHSGGVANAKHITGSAKYGD